jgi:hypothetical protein
MKRIPRASALAAAIVAGIVVVWAANHLGLWWVTALVGVALGLGFRGTLKILGATSLVAVAAWGLDLAYQAIAQPLGAAATVVAGIMGFGRAGVIVVVLALVFAWLLGAAGAWVGASVRRAAEALIHQRSAAMASS